MINKVKPRNQCEPKHLRVGIIWYGLTFNNYINSRVKRIIFTITIRVQNTVFALSWVYPQPKLLKMPKYDNFRHFKIMPSEDASLYYLYAYVETRQ